MLSQPRVDVHSLAIVRFLHVVEQGRTPRKLIRNHKQHRFFTLVGIYLFTKEATNLEMIPTSRTSSDTIMYRQFFVHDRVTRRRQDRTSAADALARRIDPHLQHVVMEYVRSKLRGD